MVKSTRERKLNTLSLPFNDKNAFSEHNPYNLDDLWMVIKL